MIKLFKIVKLFRKNNSLIIYIQKDARYFFK